jgi:hypothetical protein
VENDFQIRTVGDLDLPSAPSTFIGKKLVGVKPRKKNTILRGMRRGREGEQHIGRAATMTIKLERREV